MPTVINPEQVVGTLIPNVYISRITLESDTGFTQHSFQDNPHIDPTPDSGYTEGGKIYEQNPGFRATIQLTVKDVISNNLSKWFAQGSFPLNVTRTRRLTVKDYIKVVVIQATDPTSISNLSTLMITDQQIDSYQLNFPGAWKREFFLSELDGDPNVLERHYQEYDSEGNSVRNVSKTIWSNEGWTPLTNPATQLTYEPQNLAYFAWAEFDIQKFAQEYSIDSNYFFRNQYATAIPMTSRVNSDIVFRNGELIKNSYAFFEAQINPSSLGSSTGITTIPTNRIWTQPVHYTNSRSLRVGQDTVSYEGWIGGTQFISFSETPLLVKKIVPNTKIQDFRIVKRLEKLDLSLSNLENEVIKIVSKDPQNIINNAKFSYYTDIYFSRDKSNNCRFFFGIDLRKMVRENSVYSRLFSKNSNWLVEAMSNVRIISMRIYRQRTKGSSELGDTPFHFSDGHEFEPVHQLKKFNNGLRRCSREIPSTSTVTPAAHTSYDPSDELIIDAVEAPTTAQTLNGGKTSYVLTNAPEDTDGVSRISKIGPILSLDMKKGQSTQGIYYYTGVDGRMSQMSDGYYQYRIELEIQDNSLNFLLRKQELLSLLIDDLEGYYQIGSLPGVNGIKETERGDPHTEEENVYASAVPQEANFDPTTNRFTQKFISEQTSGWALKDFANRYKNLLSVFVNLDANDTRMVVDTLNLYTNPQTGNLQGCLIFLGLLRSLSSTLERAIGIQQGTPKSTDWTKSAEQVVNASGQTATTFESNIEKQGPPSLKTFKMKHTFPSYYDGNISRDTGFDFLGTGLNDISKIPAGGGLRIVSSDEFKNIIVPKEIEKIFKGTNSVITLHGLQAEKNIQVGTSLQDTDFTYLTPAIVQTPSTEIVMISDKDKAIPNIKTRDFINTTVGATIAASSTALIITNSLQEKIADFLSYNYNLSAIPKQEPTLPIVAPGDSNPSIPSSNKIGEYIKSSNEQTILNQQAFDVFWDLISNGVVSEGNRGNMSLPEGSNQKSVTFYNAVNPDGFLQPGVTITGPIVTSLPNPVKALIRYNDQIVSTQGGVTYESALRPEVENLLLSNPFMDPSLRSKARILFETIGEIEVHIGFGNTTYGQEQTKLMISQMAERGVPNPSVPLGTEIEEASTALPVWQKLTRSLYNTAKGKHMLCRIRRWESSIFKIQKEKGSELPIYEEYFLLHNPGEDAQMPIDTRPESPTEFTPRGPDTPAVTTVREVDFISNPRTDYITANWNAENLMTNLGDNPPAGLGGDIPPHLSTEYRSPSGPLNPLTDMSQGIRNRVQQGKTQTAVNVTDALKYTGGS